MTYHISQKEMVQARKGEKTGISVLEGWGDACTKTRKMRISCQLWGAGAPGVFEDQQGHHGWEEWTGEGKRACLGGKERGSRASQNIWGLWLLFSLIWEGFGGLAASRGVMWADYIYTNNLAFLAAVDYRGTRLEAGRLVRRLLQ